jgi:hypothetical protein
MKGKENLGNWKPVGRDGELVLYASPDREMGVLVNERTGQPTGDPQPLQVFFKWGVFTEV